MLISIAIPCYRSADTLPPLVEEIRQAFAGHPEHDYQLILVNDCSPDGTFDVIRQLCEQDEKIVGVNLSRNFGQSNASTAALPYVKGDALVYMDDDGQHPPEQLFLLVDALQEGWDVAIARLHEKKHGLFTRFTSWLSSRVLHITQKKPVDLYISSFRAFDKFMIEHQQKTTANYPLSYAYLSRLTTRITNVPIQHRPRLHGRSGYNFFRRFRIWLESFVNFSITPLRISSLVGTLFSAAGFLFGLILVIRKIVSPNIAVGYTSTIALMLLIGGLIMLMLGLIGEYIGRMFMMMNDNTTYTVREVVNPPKDEDKKI